MAITNFFLISFCALGQWAWSLLRIKKREPLPVLLPLISIWLMMAMLWGYILNFSSAQFASAFSFMPEDDSKAQDGRKVLLILWYIFVAAYGVISLMISGGMIWYKKSLKLK